MSLLETLLVIGITLCVGFLVVIKVFISRNTNVAKNNSKAVQNNGSGDINS